MVRMDNISSIVGATNLDMENHVLIQGMVETFNFDNLALHDSSLTQLNLNVAMCGI
jgi:hypothetical protein